MTLLLWIDESLPRAIAVALREGGFEARDVRDLGMRGRTDREILAEATAVGAVVISGDLDFANPLRFPPESHGGVVVMRFHRGPARGEGARELVGFLKQAGESSVRQAITILEPGRARRFGRPPPGRPTA